MNCQSCGSEIAPGKKFCSNCGAPVAQASAGQAAGPPPAPPQPTQPLTAPVPPPVVPAAPRGRSKGKTVLAIVLGLIVLAEIAVAVVFIVKAVSPSTSASVTGLVLTRKDGKALNLKKVPLDVDLRLTATFKAQYPKGGSGKIRLSVVDGNGEELVGETFTVQSNGSSQKKQYTMNMTAGSGKPIKAKAKLDVQAKTGSKASSQKTLTYTAEEGTVKDSGSNAELETTRANVQASYDDLMTSMKVANSSGTDVSDLMNQVADIGVSLAPAQTVSELDALDVQIKNLQAEVQRRMTQ